MEQPPASMYSPSGRSDTGLQRPKTRNPAMESHVLRQESSLLAEQQAAAATGADGALISPTNHDSSIYRNSNATTPKNGAGIPAALQQQAINQSGSFSHQDEGVLWSETGKDIPTSSLVRPGTSNPRLRETMTPVRHNSTPPVVVPTPTNSASPNPATTSAEVAPLGTEQPDSGRKEKGGGVLWAAEGGELDPSMIARPLTSNPWLSRVIDSSMHSDDAASPNHGIGAGGKAVLSSNEKKAAKGQHPAGPANGGSMNGENPLPAASSTAASAGSLHTNGSTSEILWSSADVDDWRLLARPHAANPTYERAKDSHTPPEEDVPPETKTGRRVSEVLWKRDETADEIVQGQRLRIEELEREVSLLRTQLLHAGLTPATALPMNYSGQQQEYQDRNYYMTAPPATTVPNASEEGPSSREETVAPEEQQAAAPTAAPHHVHYNEAQLAEKDRASATQNNNVAKKQPRPQSAQPRRPGTQRSQSPPHADRSLPGNEDDEGLIIEDDTPDDQMDPELLKTSPGGWNGTSKVQTVTTSAPGAKQSFVAKLTQEVQGAGQLQVRPGTAQPTRTTDKPISVAPPLPGSPTNTTNNAQASYNVPLVGGQSITSTTGAGTSKPGAAVLHSGAGTTAGGLHRPFSAPLQRAVVSSPTKGSALMSSCPGVARYISTTSLALDETSQMSSEFENMRREGQQFVLKRDFVESYKKRAAEFGVSVTQRQMDSMFRGFNAAGPDYLTANEFSILFLKLQQW